MKVSITSDNDLHLLSPESEIDCRLIVDGVVYDLAYFTGATRNLECDGKKYTKLTFEVKERK